MTRQEKGLHTSKWSLHTPHSTGISKANRHHATSTTGISLQPGEKLSIRPHCPPQGYTFVPKGDVYITRNCRLKTKESGQILYVVYSANSRTQLGLHVPTPIVTLVHSNADATAESRKQAVDAKDLRNISVARGELLRLYPRIPLEHAEGILAHAFLKGSGRVGRSESLTLERKIALATVSHVRHRLTQYDELLRKSDGDGLEGGRSLSPESRREEKRMKARREVARQIQDVVQSWKPAPVVGEERDKAFKIPRGVNGSRWKENDIPRYDQKTSGLDLGRKKTKATESPTTSKSPSPVVGSEGLDEEEMDWTDEYLDDGGTDDEASVDDEEDWPDAMDMS
ncbi:MAG: hypothetical protein M1833_005521 [Piccolia ochrophora]|nr:MAG: hypothetical protein M1833_005521 [Piccolia ochrophora]